MRRAGFRASGGAVRNRHPRSTPRTASFIIVPPRRDEPTPAVLEGLTGHGVAQAPILVNLARGTKQQRGRANCSCGPAVSSEGMRWAMSGVFGLTSRPDRVFYLVLARNRAGFSSTTPATIGETDVGRPAQLGLLEPPRRTTPRDTRLSCGLARQPSRAGLGVCIGVLTGRFPRLGTSDPQQQALLARGH